MGRRKLIPAGTLSTATAILYGLFILVPVLVLYPEVLTHIPFHTAAIALPLAARTSAVAATVATLATAIAIPMAAAQNRSHPLLYLFATLPLFISPPVWASLWNETFNTSVSLPRYIRFAWILLTLYLPVALAVMIPAFRQIPPSYVHSALLYAPPRQVWSRIILPLLRPAIRTAWILVFILASADFPVATTLRVRTLGTEIFQRFAAFYQPGIAVYLSFFLLLPGIIFFYEVYRPVRQMDIRDDSPAIPAGTRAGHFLRTAPLLWILTAVIPPFLTAFSHAVHLPASQWIDTAIRLLEPTRHSAVIFIYTVLLTAFFIFPAALRAASAKPPASLPAALYFFGFLIPPVVIALAFTHFYNSPVFKFLYPGLFLVAVALTGKYLFAAYKWLDLRIRRIPPDLLHAARLHTGSQIRIFRHIIFPLLRPAFLTALIITALIASAETTIPLMLYPPGRQPLPVAVFTLTSNASKAYYLAMNITALLLQTALTAILITLLFVFLHRYDRPTFGTN